MKIDDVKAHLASALGQRDEAPNIALAEAIVTKNDQAATDSLVQLLHEKNKDVRGDSVKVLYEIGERRAALLRPHLGALLDLLTTTKDNRLQWGLMTALATLVPLEIDAIYKALPRILDAAAKGSVISKDQCVRILIVLCAVPRYKDAGLALLLEQLNSALPNQLPMYAEQALAVIDTTSRASFIESLQARLADIEKDSKKKRVEKVIARLQKMK